MALDLVALATCRKMLVLFTQVRRRIRIQTLTWLLSAPQFWYGFVACAALTFLALLPTMLFPRRTVIVYSIPDRAPVPQVDPFYKPGFDNASGRTVTALRPQGEKRRQAQAPWDKRPPSLRRYRIGQARKKAIWHPHPDDSLPSWGSW